MNRVPTILKTTGRAASKYAGNPNWASLARLAVVVGAIRIAQVTFVLTIGQFFK
jgi:hypothetical protein